MRIRTTTWYHVIQYSTTPHRMNIVNRKYLFCDRSVRALPPEPYQTERPLC